jgi:hypothetical protein
MTVISPIDRNLLTGLNSSDNPEYIKVNNGSLNVQIVEGVSSSGSLSSVQTFEYVYVVDADVNGSTYFSSACVGKIKSIKQYNSSSVSGDYAVITTFEYSSSVFPTKITKRIDSVTTV